MSHRPKNPGLKIWHVIGSLKIRARKEEHYSQNAEKINRKFSLYKGEINYFNSLTGFFAMTKIHNHIFSEYFI